MISIGIVGPGQFAPSFAKLFRADPDVDRVLATDLLPERARALVEHEGLDGAVDDFETMLATDVDAVAIFTQPGPTCHWLSGPWKRASTYIPRSRWRSQWKRSGRSSPR